MVLQSIRERLTGILAFVILGILIIPFALVGVTSYFTAGDSNIVARINDTDITSNDFNQGFSDYRRRMQSILGDAYDPVEFDKLTVRRKYLDNVIDSELITQAAQSLGLDVDDETLARKILEMPAFQVNGQFNSDVYESRIRGQGFSPKRFETEIRSQIVVSQLPRNVSASSFATPAELQTFIALLDQGRTFNAVLVPAAIPATPPEFSADEISAWYESHSDEYQSKEQVVIEYIELDAALLPTGPAPEEDFLRDQFETQKARFITPEQRRVAHILFEFGADADEATRETARQSALDVSKRAIAGEDFSALAKENSQDTGSAEEGGDLGWIEPGVMVKAFENAMYELTPAKPVSEPIQTGFGWHVIKLLEIREATGMSFEEARPLLVTEYEEDSADRAFLEQADQLVDLIYEDPTTLESAALVMGLEVKKTAPFTRAGGAGIATNPEAVEAAFSPLVLLQGSVSDPINLDDKSLVMIKLGEYFPVALKPLETVRDEIVATLGDNLARDNARAQADELLAALQSGEKGLETLAADAGLEYAPYEAIKRNSFVPDATLVKEIFRLPVPAQDSPIRTVLPGSTGFAVVELLAVIDGKLAEGAPLARLQYGRVLANGKASQEAFALMRQLRSSAKIQIYEDRIQ